MQMQMSLSAARDRQSVYFGRILIIRANPANACHVERLLFAVSATGSDWVGLGPLRLSGHPARQRKKKPRPTASTRTH
jgi:hypothetical protein